MTGIGGRVPFLPHLQRAQSIRRLLDERLEPGRELRVTGLAGSLKGLTAALFFIERQLPVLVICPDSDSALDTWNDAVLAAGEENALFLGERGSRLGKKVQTLDSTFSENADALRAFTENPRRLLVTDAETLAVEFPSASEIRQHSLRLEHGQSHRQEDLVRRLAYGGYERNDFVTANGEYAVRGGIVDVYPVGFDNPVRIEFFGEEIDSLREFEAMSQRSIRTLDSLAFMTSLFLDGGEETQHSTVFDYLPADTLLFVTEPEAVKQHAERQGWGHTLDSSLAPFARILLTPVRIQGGATPILLGGEPQPAFNGSIKLLKETIAELASAGTALFLVADSEQQVRRLDDLLHSDLSHDDEEREAEAREAEAHLPVFYSPIAEGFLLPADGIAVFTEHQVFNRRRIQQRARKGTKGMSLREMKQLHVGDYVVHVDKGIGKFAGIETITVNGGLQETAKILYAGDDALYVNLNFINRLQKYTAEENYSPKLSRLGSGEWERAKERTKRRLKDIARDLIGLYAKRKMAQGFAFSPDSTWQQELEASFIYEDTPDQYQATVDVKRDMMEPVPMDRLVCGDVGYGKTEVAVRAAFKAVLDGKQVAVLVPTTILAQQHFHTFHDRLHRYSVRVETLSRFKARPQQTAILRTLKAGAIDVLIGTHRILSADVQFKDLGLLIVDEEHRFGVADKEKLRQLRENIDTMTMTATPIPRTLNFSLLGARDLSVIETPPKNRLPITTSIMPFHEEVIAEGIMQEIDRGGQVYFVNDRISDLDVLADTIRAAVPGVRVGIAHGQMKPAELERVMTRFLERKLDVLATTKIVESGLDIPNANTIFINRADRFGLAELYQLRGRVGRSNIQAYSWLLIPAESRLSRDALKRLQAIEEFSELGTGFQLAMRDMEIRGAGNLLGAEQSGFITEIGFDLYLSMVDEAVRELKTEEFKGLFTAQGPPGSRLRQDVVMELGLDAYFPQDYVPNSTERFDLYRRLYKAESMEEIKEIEDEVFDRFGLLPPEAETLFTVVRLRFDAALLHLARVTWEAPRLVLAFPPDDDEPFYARFFQPLLQWMIGEGDRAKLEQSPGQVRMILGDIADLDAVRRILSVLRRFCLPEEAGTSEAPPETAPAKPEEAPKAVAREPVPAKAAVKRADAAKTKPSGASRAAQRATASATKKRRRG